MNIHSIDNYDLKNIYNYLKSLLNYQSILISNTLIGLGSTRNMLKYITIKESKDADFLIMF